MKNSKIYPWIVVALLWGVALLNYMDRQMLSTMKDAMQLDIAELQSATNFGRLMADCRKSFCLVCRYFWYGICRNVHSSILVTRFDGSE